MSRVFRPAKIAKQRQPHPECGDTYLWRLKEGRRGWTLVVDFDRDDPDTFWDLNGIEFVYLTEEIELTAEERP